jgi:hypothetical protein
MSTNSIYYVVDKYREFLRQNSDDSVYTDEFLYSMLLQSRAEIIKNMVDNNKELSPWLYQRFCIKLCASNFIECDCAGLDSTIGCTVWRSEKPIPEFINQNDNLLLNVSELFGNIINQIRERAYRTVKYRKYKVDFYYLIGDLKGEKYLFILSPSSKIPPKYIKAEGVLSDPSEISEFLCESQGECFDPLGSGFALDISKHNALFKLTTELMAISAKAAEDRTNNTESTPPQNQI